MPTNTIGTTKEFLLINPKIGAFGNKLGINIQKMKTPRKIPYTFCALDIGGNGFFLNISILIFFIGSTSGRKINFITKTTDIIKINPKLKQTIK